MKILLFGSSGQLGQALTKALNHLHKIHLSRRDICDLTKPSQIQNLIDHAKPDLILNAAAYNDVDAAENHYEEAFALLPAADKQAQKPGLMMASIYRTLLREIEADDFQVLHQRIALTPLRKLWLAWKVQALGRL